MPKWVNNVNKEVDKMIRQKQELEVSLAWELLEEFNIANPDRISIVTLSNEPWLKW